MTSITRAFRFTTPVILVSILALLLAACGASTPPAASGSTPATPKGPITIGGKLDIEAQLFTEMYSQLLTKAGYTVNEKLAYGDTPTNLKAIQNGDIDLYAEFTGTALSLLKLQSTFDPQKDYAAIKEQYEQKYKITWLDRAANLSDGYALCMKKDKAQAAGITNLSELKAKVPQLTLETPSDGTDFVDGLKATYGFTTTSFKQTQTVQYGVAVTAVANSQADVTVCYGTDIGIPKQGLVFLQDDKNGFPAFNPSPTIRDAVLTKYPDIATTLNALAPSLTTQVSLDLQKQVDDKKASMSAKEAIKEVVKAFLQSKNLL